MHKKRILCISPTFVPQADPEAFCGAKLIQSLLKMNVMCKVIYEDNKKMRKDDSALWAYVGNSATGIEIPSKWNKLKSIALGLKYQHPYSSRIIGHTIEEAYKLHQKERFDVVYSRSLPMISHIMGYWVSKQCNLPWIVNINDPWDWHLFPTVVNSRVSEIYKIISLFWLKKTLKNAGMVIYPSKRLRDFHINLSNTNHRSEIVPHIGYSNNHVSTGSNKFLLVHAGIVSTKEAMRNPCALLKGLRLLFERNPEASRSTELVFVGPKDSSTVILASELGIENNITYTGLINYEDSLKYIGSASVCVLIEAKMKEGIYLPSKMADYLVAKKPILALSPATGTINDMLPEKGIIRVNHDDPIGVADALADYYNHYCNGTLIEKAPSAVLVKKFTPETVVDKFLSAVNDLLSNGKKAAKHTEIIRRV